MKLRARTIAAVAAVAVLGAGCSCAGSGGTASTGTPATTAGATSAASGFGSLTDVCHPGNASGAPDQGVTSTQIKLGVLTDVGFTKNPDLINAAHVFTSWCNAAGGIDGRKLVADISTQTLADGYVDFAAAMQDPSDPSDLNPAYASVDNLHPNLAGYQAMANAVPLPMLRAALP